MSLLDTAPHAEVRYSPEPLQQLREALQRLHPEEKEVFLLRQNGEWTYEQIAHLHKRPVGFVKDQMRSVLRKLGTVLQAHSSGSPDCSWASGSARAEAFHAVKE